MRDVLIYGPILTICMYPFVVMMYAMLKSEATPKKGIYYGVTLSKEQGKAPEIAEITKRYNKQMNQNLLWVMVAPLPMLIIPWFSIWLVFWSLWFLYSLFGFYLPFFAANKSMKALKEEKGWRTENEAPVYVELKKAGTLRTVKWLHFLPQCLIGLAVFVVTILICPVRQVLTMGIVQGSFAGITFLFWLAAIWMDKLKTQIISTNSDVNVNYNRAKKRIWKNLWVACAWVNVLYMGGISVLVKGDIFHEYFLFSSLIYTVITAVLALWMLRKQACLVKRYKDKMDIEVVDDDSYWIGGVFYHNPKDNHFFVEQRYGKESSGTTVNLAKPAAKVLTGIVLLMILAMPAMGVWTIMLEFTPIELRVENNKLIGEQIREDVVIPLHTIKEAELLNERPKMSKNSGTAMENIYKGSFRLKEDKSHCEIFLNPQNNVFLRIETSMEVYYLSGFDDAQTREVYEMLKANIQ